MRSRHVHDYSFVLPHGSLNGRIPMEVYTNQQMITDIKTFMIQAKTEHIEQNQNVPAESVNKSTFSLVQQKSSRRLLSKRTFLFK